MRFHVAAYGGLAFLLGTMFSGQHIEWPTFAGLWCIGVVVNGSIFALNDFVDLPRDRQNPARQRSALVAGRVSQRWALSLATTLPLLATASAALMSWSGLRVAAFSMLLGVAVLVNIYQKASRYPLLMEILFAVTMVVPLPLTSWAEFGQVPSQVWLATLSFFWLSLELDSICGNLKDLSSDLATGFRTLAVHYGVTVATDGNINAGRKYYRYALVLHLLNSVTLAALSWTSTRDLSTVERIPVMLIVIVLILIGWLDFYLLIDGKRSPAPNGRDLFIGAGLTVFLTSAVVQADSWLGIAAISVALAWELIYRAIAYARQRSAALEAKLNRAPAKDT
ncbi:UbiA prenyltransferase family protein [Mycobacterium ahvazicum]|nr:UbiA prenyltransferase family protein [Mycobacterium ahvazicum]